MEAGSGRRRLRAGRTMKERACDESNKKTGRRGAGAVQGRRFLETEDDCDGIYEPNTEKALRAFQSANFLMSDGLFGKESKSYVMERKVRNANNETVIIHFTHLVHYH